MHSLSRWLCMLAGLGSACTVYTRRLLGGECVDVQMVPRWIVLSLCRFESCSLSARLALSRQQYSANQLQRRQLSELNWFNRMHRVSRNNVLLFFNGSSSCMSPRHMGDLQFNFMHQMRSRNIFKHGGKNSK